MKKEKVMLTEHFSYEEMTRSDWATEHNADNTPDALALMALKNLCQKVLEPLRREFGPICINSGYRSPKVNEGVHGVGNSKHLTGEAVDIRLPNQETGRAYFRFIKSHCDIDQLLFEYNRAGAIWIHCSVCLDDRCNRHQVFPNYRA